MTYNDWWNTYLTVYKRKLKPKTLESYARCHQLLSPLHDTALEDLSPEEIQRAINGAEDLAGSRQAQLCFAAIRAALNRAARSRVILWNPVSALDKPQHTTAPGKAITDEDWAILSPIIADDIGLALCGLAGLRRGEACGLLWGDVDLKSGVIHVRRQLQRQGGRMRLVSPKSSAGVRDIPVCPLLLSLLRSEYRLQPKARVFEYAPETLDRRWRSAQSAAGTDYRLHDLRHTYATRLVRAGCNFKVVQYLMGHSNITVTLSTYSHIDAAAAASELLALSLH